MAWPASTQRLVTAFEAGDRLMTGLKSLLERVSTQSQTQNVQRKVLLNIKGQCDQLDSIMSTTISYGQSAVDYARAEYRLPAIDVIAEYTAVRDAVRALSQWIGSSIPNGMALTEYSGGTETSLTFTPAQLADFRTNAATVTILIE